MSDDSGCKIRDLLPDRMEQLADVMRTELEQQGAVDGGGGRGRLAWSLVASEASDAIAGVLDDDVFELLARGWCLARELREYSDQAKHPAGERSVVHLGEHRFSTSVQPTLKVSIDGLVLPSLRFTLEVTAHVQAIALEIEDGRIRAVAAGECYLTAQLKYGDVALHKAPTSRHLKLPGRARLAPPGLAISRATT
jgi:hypothetical protein